MGIVYESSRWTNGNLFFPDSLVLADDGVHFQKRRLFGSDEQHINYKAIASVKINSGILFEM